MGCPRRHSWEYDGLLAERVAAAKAGRLSADSAPPEPHSPARSSPEARARILEMIKRGNSKYAKPFEKDRLAAVSIFGDDWEEYGQIVLQMAILRPCCPSRSCSNRPRRARGRLMRNP